MYVCVCVYTHTHMVGFTCCPNTYRGTIINVLVETHYTHTHTHTLTHTHTHSHTHTYIHTWSIMSYYTAYLTPDHRKSSGSYK